jgi:hypothetical protein
MRVLGLIFAIASLGVIAAILVRHFLPGRQEREKPSFHINALVVVSVGLMAWIAVFFFLEFLHDIRGGRW